MLGAIAGDVIGSVYEFRPVKTTVFPLFSAASRFTDDSVLTLATAAALLLDGDYGEAYRTYCRHYPDRGYGERFLRWALADDTPPYQSLGNGSAMRVSPVAWARSSLADALAEARKSAEVTHDHPEGIRGAQATAAGVFLARAGASKEEIRRRVEEGFGYDLGVPMAELRPGYRFDVTCPGTVPAALRAFLEAEDYEDAVRLAISLGGDADTLACIAGSVAEAYYGGVPAPIAERVLALLDEPLVRVLDDFRERFQAAPAWA